MPPVEEKTEFASPEERGDIVAADATPEEVKPTEATPDEVKAEEVDVKADEAKTDEAKDEGKTSPPEEKSKGYKVNAIEPQAAIYLTVQLDLRGAKTAAGKLLDTNHAVHRYILDEAKTGLVPMSYFGASEESSWYRLSVGTCRLEEVEVIMSNLEDALSKLS